MQVAAVRYLKELLRKDSTVPKGAHAQNIAGVMRTGCTGWRSPAKKPTVMTQTRSRKFISQLVYLLLLFTFHQGVSVSEEGTCLRTRE